MLLGSSSPSSHATDDCSICFSILAQGAPLLTLSCNHKFHLQCLVSNIQAQNKECPLCRALIDASVVQLVTGHNQPVLQQPLQQTSVQTNVDSVEDLVDEAVVRTLSDRFASDRRAAVASATTISKLPSLTTTATLEYGAQVPQEESNIYGLVTLQAQPAFIPTNDDVLASSRVPIDLVCVVDQSGSMSGDKMTLLKQTLVYITEQLNDLDRLAIVSFSMIAYDRSHGLKRMNHQNRQLLTAAINNNINSGGGTHIGFGLEMGIRLFTNRQTKNPLGALLLLTDGQDSRKHDYSQLMQALPEGVSCHSFGYGPDHAASLLVQLAEQGNAGTFTYIDKEEAVGPAFAMTLGGLFTCVAQQLRVNIEFIGQYEITHVHSKYQYEPTRLPSAKLTVNLNDLNADEKRNLIFQLHVPKVHNDQTVEMTSQPIMSQDEQTLVDPQQTIGNVTVTYVDPNIGRTLTTTPIAFQLVRAAQPSADLLQVNLSLDIQRNRVETARVLKLAMDASNYERSHAILKAQVDKIKASASAQDPFCQRLIQDLQHRFPTERDYRSSHTNAYRQHCTERGTYAPHTTTSTPTYLSIRQVQQASHFLSKHS